MCGLAVANEDTCRPFPAPGERQKEASELVYRHTSISVIRRETQISGVYASPKDLITSCEAARCTSALPQALAAIPIQNRAPDTLSDQILGSELKEPTARENNAPEFYVPDVCG